MGTISSARGIIGLSAVGTHTSTNTDGTAQVGLGNTTLSYASADIAYSLQVTAAAGTDVATLNLQTGDVAQTTGSPVAVDDGADFEGDDLTTAVTLYSILIEMEPAGTAAISVELEDTASPVAEAYCQAENSGNTKALMDFGAGIPAGDMTLVINFGTTADVVKVTVIAGSS